MSLRLRMILIFTLIVSAGFYFLTDWILNDLRPHYLESLEEALVDQAEILAGILSVEIYDEKISSDSLNQVFKQIYAKPLSAKIYSYTKEKVDLRVYITDKKGIVIFDSSGKDLGRDYSLWRNIVLAMRGEYGTRTSHEKKFSGEDSALHVSSPIYYENKVIGVVTVAKPTTSINQFITSATPQITVASIVAALSVILFGGLFSVWITRPIHKLQLFARDVQAGKKTSVPRLGKNEMGELAVAFDDMRESLEGKKYVEHYIHSLTHELKSPIAAIHAAGEILSEGTSVADQEHFLKNIKSESERMQNIVDRLLDLATLENLRVLKNSSPIEVSAFVEKNVSAVLNFSNIKKIKIRVECEKTSLCCDEFLLGQALCNLLQNAIDFSPQDGEILIQCQRQQEWLRIQILDQGPGIPEYALSQVFERFFSLPRPDTGRKSTGLGLSFVKQIIELHRGRIKIRNRTDRNGSEVIIDLHSPLRKNS